MTINQHRRQKSLLRHSVRPPSSLHNHSVPQRDILIADLIKYLGHSFIYIILLFVYMSICVHVYLCASVQSPLCTWVDKKSMPGVCSPSLYNLFPRQGLSLKLTHMTRLYSQISPDILLCQPPRSRLPVYPTTPNFMYSKWVLEI